MKKKVDTLVAGDRVLNADGSVAYTIIEAGIDNFALVWADKPWIKVWATVEWADGGRDYRVWDDAGITVEVAE